MEADVLEKAVCTSRSKQLHLRRHPSGRRWVEVSGRRFVGQVYVDAVSRLHAERKLELKMQAEDHDLFELGEHSCTTILKT